MKQIVTLAIIGLNLTHCSLWLDPDRLSRPVSIKAVDDALTATRGKPATTTNVLANDDNPVGGQLSIISWTQGEKGNVSYNGDGTFTWEPRVSIASGTDAFQYTAKDAKGHTASATVNVTIAPSWGQPTWFGQISKTVSSLVTDDAGNVTMVWPEISDAKVATLRASRYVAADGTWSAPANVSVPFQVTDGSTAFSSLDLWHVVADQSGNVTIVWKQSDGSSSALWANQWPASGNPGTATQLTIKNQTILGYAHFAILDQHRHATVVWITQQESTYALWAARKTENEPWNKAIQIDSSASEFSNLVLQSDSQGNVIALWHSSNRETSEYSVRSARITVENKLDGPYNISQDTGNIDPPAMTIDRNGLVTAVWAQIGQGKWSLWSNRMYSNGAWRTAELLEQDDTGHVAQTQPSVTVDDFGNVTTVFCQEDASGTAYLWSNRLSADKATWQGPVKIENSKDAHCGLDKPTVITKIDSMGNIMAIWPDSHGQSLHASRMSYSGSWTPAEAIGPLIQGNYTRLYGVYIFVDGGQYITVAWTTYDGHFFSNRFDVQQSKWGATQSIQKNNGEFVKADYRPAINIDGAGNITAIWLEADNIWANQMDAGSGAWGKAISLDEINQPGKSGPPLLAFDSQGQAVATWYREGDTRQIVIKRLLTDVWSSPEVFPVIATNGPVQLNTLLSTKQGLMLIGDYSCSACPYLTWASDYR